MIFRRNEGFTLVELMVSILAASIVTLAATTVLLLGMRINHQSSKVVTQQTTTRILMSALENMAAEGVIVDARGDTNGWIVTKELISSDSESSNKEGSESVEVDPDDVVLSYVRGTEGTYTGKIMAKDTVLLDGIKSSSIKMEDSGLLTCMVETEDGKYEMIVYCRTVDTAKTQARNAKRNALLQALVSQLYSDEANKVPNEGTIVGPDRYSYYSQLFNYDGNAAWCTHFVYWGLYSIGDSAPTVKTEAFANIRDLAPYFSENAEGHRWESRDGNYIPIPGDLIFMDAKGVGYIDHVGVVISVAGGYVYTIEGNVEIVVEIETVDEITGETVTVTETKHVVKLNKYSLTHETIQGYGVLNWD